MRTITLTLVMAVALSGCSKKSNTKPTTGPTPTGARSWEKPADKDKGQTPVSPNIALSADLAQACGIQANHDVPPNFDYNKAELAAEDRAILEKVATCLTTGPLKGRGLDLIGRADPRGTQEYNMGLGARRASAVGDYLRRLGVKPPQLAESTKGDLEATGTNEETWAKDRRVDLNLRAN